MLRISISPFVDDGCCLRMWSLHPILPVEYSFTEAQSNIGWMTKMDEKSSSGLSIWAELLYQILKNTVTVHTERHTQIGHSTHPLQLSNISTTFLQAFLITAACVPSDKAADIPCGAGGKWCIQQHVIITWQSDNL